MSGFEASRYTVSIRKEDTEDGTCFVARVLELPDVAIYENEPHLAYEAALDVIETAKEMYDDDGGDFPLPICPCAKCVAKIKAVNQIMNTSIRMILCPRCGNKRCPHATDHNYECTDSNDSGQPGSAYK